MVDLFKAETVNSDILIDEKMSIVTADENFEAISGNNRHCIIWHIQDIYILMMSADSQKR